MATVIENEEPLMDGPGEIKEAVVEKKVSEHEIPGLLRSLERLSANERRSKPAYSDCWMIDSDEGDVVERYDIPCGTVTIKGTDDGQAEYRLLPSEYKFDDRTNYVINSVINDIRNSFPSRGTAKGTDLVSAAKNMLIAHSDQIPGDADSLEEMVSVVRRYTTGMGIFEILLGDPRLEDIYIDAPCDKNRIHVTLNGIAGFNSHIRCRTNLIAEKREVRNLIS
ncbi:MAG: hypothetical protein FWG19_04285, partial [Methanomassiliicoccaceae archaeon]|nr:hypothetical protein [Methanomassiliicoccaceae archaeon]